MVKKTIGELDDGTAFVTSDSLLAFEEASSTFNVKVSTMVSLPSLNLAFLNAANSWGAFNQNISATGKWQEAGVPISPIGKHSHYVNVADMYPNITDPASEVTFESATNLINVQAMVFLAASNDFASYTWIPPPEWDAGTVTVKYYWSSPNGTAAQVVEFQIAALAYSLGDVLDIAFPATTSVTDVLTAINSLDITAESSDITIGNTPAKGDIVVFQIERDALAGSDTLTGAVRLTGMEIFYTTDAATAA